MGEGTVTGGESGDARLWQTLGRIEQQGKTSAAQISELYKRQREVDQTGCSKGEALDERVKKLEAVPGRSVAVGAGAGSVAAGVVFGIGAAIKTFFMKD